MQTSVTLSQPQLKRIDALLALRQKTNAMYKRADVIREVVEAGLATLDLPLAKKARR